MSFVRATSILTISLVLMGIFAFSAYAGEGGGGSGSPDPGVGGPIADSCDDIGQIGTWPDGCYYPTCANSGLYGTYPNCHPITCQDLGASNIYGTYPACYASPQISASAAATTLPLSNPAAWQSLLSVFGYGVYYMNMAPPVASVTYPIDAIGNYDATCATVATQAGLASGEYWCVVQIY